MSIQLQNVLFAQLINSFVLNSTVLLSVYSNGVTMGLLMIFPYTGYGLNFKNTVLPFLVAVPVAVVTAAIITIIKWFRKSQPFYHIRVIFLSATLYIIAGVLLSLKTNGEYSMTYQQM